MKKSLKNGYFYITMAMAVSMLCVPFCSRSAAGRPTGILRCGSLTAIRFAAR